MGHSFPEHSLPRPRPLLFTSPATIYPAPDALSWEAGPAHALLTPSLFQHLPVEIASPETAVFSLQLKKGGSPYTTSPSEAAFAGSLCDF